MSNTNIQTAYEQIRKANLIAGQLTPTNDENTLDGIEMQINILFEELKETYDAFTEQDVVELLDGACDIFVVAAGLLQKLEAAGMNVEKALARVCANNISKFPLESDYRNNLELKPEGAVVSESPYGHVVFKRPSDGKYLKPTNFVSVDLKSCVTTDLFGGEV